MSKTKTELLPENNVYRNEVIEASKLTPVDSIIVVMGEMGVGKTFEIDRAEMGPGKKIQPKPSTKGGTIEIMLNTHQLNNTVPVDDIIDFDEEGNEIYTQMPLIINRRGLRPSRSIVFDFAGQYNQLFKSVDETKEQYAKLEKISVAKRKIKTEEINLNNNVSDLSMKESKEKMIKELESGKKIIRKDMYTALDQIRKANVIELVASLREPETINKLYKNWLPMIEQAVKEGANPHISVYLSCAGLEGAICGLNDLENGNIKPIIEHEGLNNLLTGIETTTGHKPTVYGGDMEIPVEVEKDGETITKYIARLWMLKGNKVIETKESENSALAELITEYGWLENPVELNYKAAKEQPIIDSNYENKLLSEGTLQVVNKMEKEYGVKLIGY